MKYLRKINSKNPSFQITTGDVLIFAGSCFSDSMSARFEKDGVETYSNPYGTLYNPYSLFIMFKEVLACKVYTKENLYLDEKIYVSLHHSSLFSDINPDKVLELINTKILDFHSLLKRKVCVFITLGSSVVYELNGLIVANCHRIPSAKFNRRLLSVDEVVLYIIQLKDLLLQFNPEVNLVFTVSPIRHYPDDLQLNTLSKATLHVALNEVRASDSRLYYFPSYEIALDVLSDYKYFKKDMIHLSKRAEKFIYKKLCLLLVDRKLSEYMKSFKKLQKDCNHRPRFPGNDAYYQFLKNLIGKIKLLKQKYTFARTDFLEDNILTALLKYYYDKDGVNEVLTGFETRYSSRFLCALHTFCKEGTYDLLSDYEEVFQHSAPLQDLIKSKLYANLIKRI